VAVMGLARGEGTELPQLLLPVHVECVSYENDRLCLSGGGGGLFAPALVPKDVPVETMRSWTSPGSMAVSNSFSL